MKIDKQTYVDKTSDIFDDNDLLDIVTVENIKYAVHETSRQGTCDCQRQLQKKYYVCWNKCPLYQQCLERQIGVKNGQRWKILQML